MEYKSIDFNKKVKIIFLLFEKKQNFSFSFQAPDFVEYKNGKTIDRIIQNNKMIDFIVEKGDLSHNVKDDEGDILTSFVKADEFLNKITYRSATKAQKELVECLKLKVQNWQLKSHNIELGLFFYSH